MPRLPKTRVTSEPRDSGGISMAGLVLAAFLIPVGRLTPRPCDCRPRALLEAADALPHTMEGPSVGGPSALQRLGCGAYIGRARR